MSAELTSNNCRVDVDPAVIPIGFHRCPTCGALVSDERRELLGIAECIPCTPQKRRPIGAWDYPEGFHERNEGVGGLIIID